MADGKFPKKPEYGNVLEACRKDFKHFKKDNGNQVIEHFYSEVDRLSKLGDPSTALLEKSENLERVSALIHEGRDDIAFSIFFRTFPSCLPHRMRNL